MNAKKTNTARTTKTTNTARKSAGEGKAAARVALAAPVAKATAEKHAPLTYRVFQLPEQVWEQLKATAHSQQESARLFIDNAIASQVQQLRDDLLAVGMKTAETKRVRMARPTMWGGLLNVAEETGVSAQQLMVLCAQRALATNSKKS